MEQIETRPASTSEPLITTAKQLCFIFAFSVAFAYIESAVVVYLRAIFHPDGFTFPLMVFGSDAISKRFLLTEIGREAATIVLIITSCWLFGRSFQQRFAFFLIIFAVWDIFYYVWLKVLIDWPGSIMDWDILFLVPRVWAGPVLAPVITSVVMLMIAAIILRRCGQGNPIRTNRTDCAGFVVGGLLVVFSFCAAGLHIIKPDFQSHFSWILFGLGHILVVGLFAKALLRSN